MLYMLVMAVHIIVSLVLISVILLQAGRGGGLSESFGGSSTQTLFGTKTNVFLMRATAASAVIYIMTCLLLGVMTAHRGRSLVAKEKLAVPTATKGPVIPQPLLDETMDF